MIGRDQRRLALDLLLLLLVLCLARLVLVSRDENHGWSWQRDDALAVAVAGLSVWPRTAVSCLWERSGTARFETWRPLFSASKVDSSSA